MQERYSRWRVIPGPGAAMKIGFVAFTSQPHLALHVEFEVFSRQSSTGCDFFDWQQIFEHEIVLSIRSSIV